MMFKYTGESLIFSPVIFGIEHDLVRHLLYGMAHYYIV